MLLAPEPVKVEQVGRVLVPTRSELRLLNVITQRPGDPGDELVEPEDRDDHTVAVLAAQAIADTVVESGRCQHAALLQVVPVALVLLSLWISELPKARRVIDLYL